MSEAETVAQTTEIVPATPAPIEHRETYIRASELVTTPEERTLLAQPVDVTIVDITANGLVYLPQVFFRQKLNDTFGVGQWALIQNGVCREDEERLFFDGSLYVRGCFVSRAVGEAMKHEGNRQQSWASVYESAKSDCITRCCKDLGVAKELWQPRFGETWKAEYAVKVWVARSPNRPWWRHRDAQPFYDEKGATAVPVVRPASDVPPPDDQPVPAPEPAGGITKCPKCGGPIYDNRLAKTEGIPGKGKMKATAPDYKCKDKEGCGWIKWPGKEQSPPPADDRPAPDYREWSYKQLADYLAAEVPEVDLTRSWHEVRATLGVEEALDEVLNKRGKEAQERARPMLVVLAEKCNPFIGA